MISQAQVDTVRMALALGRRIHGCKWQIEGFAMVDLRREPLAPDVAQTFQGVIMVEDDQCMPRYLITPWGVWYMVGAYKNSPGLIRAVQEALKQFTLETITIPPIQTGVRMTVGRVRAVRGYESLKLPAPSLKPRSAHMKARTAGAWWRTLLRTQGY